MQDFANKKIVLGISGGIAAYKIADLVRKLCAEGALVRVIMTASAQAFITPMTFQALSGEGVRSELFDSEAERAMGHIELARWADYLVIAPASANCIAKMAHGLADDLLSTLYLVTETPVIICPAMNKSMWAHPATEANCKTLLARGVIIVGPLEGAQACGEYGFGRMSEVFEILAALRLYEVSHLLDGRDVLITAGPTREMIDPVRYISNRSSGKMGYALARAARMAGAKVTLISGPTTIDPPSGIDFVRVTSACEMHDAVMSHLKPGIIFIGAAAVADYHVEAPLTDKLKKQDNAKITLTLIKNADILSAVAFSETAGYVVGFAAETTNILNYALEKLHSKKLDMIITNQVGEGMGFECDDNQVVVIANNAQTELPMTNKTRLAGQIIAILATNLQNVAN